MKELIKEWALRFALGGTVSLVAAVIAKLWGPEVGGLFLAFPAIFPASVTLVKKKDGKKEGAEDARGAIFGSLGLTAFSASFIFLHQKMLFPLCLLVCLAAWGLLSFGARFYFR